MEKTREELEQHISKLQQLVKLKNAAEKLEGNRDFKLLIGEEYLQAEPARLVKLAGDPRLTEKQREDANAMAVATGHFERFLHVTIQMGRTAEEEIGETREQIDDLEAEEEAAQANALDSSVIALAPEQEA